jgi:hypothetical protein
MLFTASTSPAKEEENDHRKLAKVRYLTVVVTHTKYSVMVIIDSNVNAVGPKHFIIPWYNYISFVSFKT